MKKVIISNVTPLDKETIYTDKKYYYQVSLGNFTKHKFTSEKAAYKFLQHTSNMLTECYYDLVHIYVATEALYWKAYMTMDNYHPSQLSIRARLYTVPDQLDKIIHQDGKENGNHFAFTFFFSALESIIVVCDLLIKSAKELWRYGLELQKRKAFSIKKRLSEYPDDIDKAADILEGIRKMVNELPRQ